MRTAVLKQDSSGRNVVEYTTQASLVIFGSGPTGYGVQVRIDAPDLAALDVAYAELGEKIESYRTALALKEEELQK